MGKVVMPFKKGAHTRVVKTIAQGMQEAGQNAVYAELGVQRGHCFNVVAPFFKKAYAVDINDNKSYLKGNKNLVWFHGKTQDFISKHQNVKFDMVFIDADHSFEASLKDFDGISKLVKDNGIILLHDTYPPSETFTSKSYCYDTYKTADYIRKNYSQEFEIVTLPFYMGVSVVRKSWRQLNWK